MRKIMKSLIWTVVTISTITYMSPVYAIANKETIYSKINSNGDVYKTIVTTKDGEDLKQEETEKELPLESKITYKLDGKEIKPEELLGKSGEVKIKIEYKNKSAKNVVINGKSETLYTPFMVTLGTVINSKNNKNIKVSKGGRIVENGDKTIIVGAIFPGLEESLNLSGKLSKIEFPDSIEITMDAKNFEMSNIITYATPKVLTEDIDWSELDDLFNKVNELQNGINTIEDGAKELNKGTKQLDDGAKELKKGTSKVYDGSKQIKNQVMNSIKGMENNNEKVLDKETLSSIGQQASKQASTTIEKEVEGIKSLAEKGAVNEIKKQEDTVLNGVMSLIKNKINSKMSELVTGISQGVTKAMGTQLETIEKQAVTAGVSSIDLSGLSKNAKVGDITVSVGDDYKDSEEYKSLDEDTQKLVNKIVEKIVGNVEKEAGEKAKAEAQEELEKYISAEEKEINGIATKAATVAATVTSKGLSSGVIRGVAEASAKETANQIVSQMANEETKKTISTKLEDLAKQVAGGTAESVAKQVAPSVAEKTAMTVADTVADEVKTEVLKQVKNQMETLLNEGLTPLTAGLRELDKGASQLKDGTKMLSDGTTKLSDGIAKFDSEGISKISNFVNGDLQNLVTRGKKLEQLANEFDKFNSDEKREEISFVSIVDSIKKEEKNEDEKSN